MPKRLHGNFKTVSAPVTRRRTVKNPDVNKHYRFARQDRVSILADDFQYAPVQDPQGGVVTSGQDVLLACPRKEFEARQRQRKRAAAEDRRGPIESFKMQGLRSGVPTVDVGRERMGSMRSVLGEADPRLSDAR